MWSRALDVYRYGQAVAVRNRHDFRAFAAFCFSNLRAPFLAGAKLPSIKASRTSKLPRALRSTASASRTPGTRHRGDFTADARSGSFRSSFGSPLASVFERQIDIKPMREMPNEFHAAWRKL